MNRIELPERLPAGTVLDGYYEITGHIGQGGFADVYSGVQRDTGSKIAIKLLKPAAPSQSKETFEKRFVQEARVAARISHPNVVTIFACRQQMKVQLPGGEPGIADRLYLVMDLLEGRPLEDEIKQGGAIVPERAIPLVIGSLDGLAKGHELGIVHKDLKPANLFLTDLGGRNESMKILDFGVARAGQGLEERLTMSGQIAMTPQYAAPEYLEHLIATPALDVYQMALVLVEMLIGHPVVQVDSLVACVMAHASGVAIPAAILASPLGPVLRKALDLDHTARYPGAAEFADALEALGPKHFGAIRRALRELEQGEKSSVPVTAALTDTALMPFSGTTTDIQHLPRRTWGLWAIGGLSLLLLSLIVATTALLWRHMQGDEHGGALPEAGASCGSPQECLEAAKKVYFAPPLRRDYERASALFKVACRRGQAEACSMLGLMRTYGHGVSLDDEKAAALFRKACTKGFAEGCSRLGFLYWLGLGVPKNDKTAVKYLRRGCKGGDEHGCASMGVVYALGVTVPRSESKAFSFYKKACAENYPTACQSLARAYDGGKGTKTNHKRAKKYYRKAAKYAENRCHQGDPESCRILGSLYAAGTGIKKSVKRAAKYYDLSCRGGSGPGCVSSGIVMLAGTGTKKNRREAVDRFRRACARNDMDACTFLASFHQQGLVVETSYVDSAHFYRKACKLGGATACNNLGTMLLRQEIKAQTESEMEDLFERAVDLYRRYCAAGSPDQCTGLGVLYESGQGVAASRTQALKYYKQGCRGGDERGCVAKARLEGAGD